MKSFSEFSDFLIDLEFRNLDNNIEYKKIFIDSEINEELSIFIDDRIAQLECNILKLALILKKYDILDQTKKNNYLKEFQDEILNIFFSAYSKEEYFNYISLFLVHFKPLRNKNFILEYYLENHEKIGNPFGLINKFFIFDAKFPKEKLCNLIELAIDINNPQTKNFDIVGMEVLFEICEKMQIYNLQAEVAKRLVDYFILSANNSETTQRNLITHQAFKYIDHYGTDKSSKRKELLNSILENANEINSYFEENKKIHEFEFDKDVYEEKLAYIREVGAHKALYNIAHYLFNLYDYNNEKEKGINELNIIYNIAAVIAYDQTGLPLYIVNNKNFDDIFFHEKTTDITLMTFLFTKYINYIRENSDFETYISEFYLPESLAFIRDLGILDDFKERNFYGFISQMIPIIESHFRYCLGLVNEPYITPNGIGGYDFLPMKAFLESNVIREKLGINAIYILKLIYDDRRGLNYRNKLAHGIINPLNVTEVEANLVFLTLIFISYFDQKLN